MFLQQKHIYPASFSVIRGEGHKWEIFFRYPIHEWYKQPVTLFFAFLQAVNLQL